MSKAPKAVKRQVAIGKAYQTTFGAGDGRVVLIDLMRRAGMLEASPSDGLYETGRRSMMVEIMSILRYDYAKLLALAEERVDENPDSE